MVMAWIPAHTQDTITRPLDRWFYNCWVGDIYNMDSLYYYFGIEPGCISAEKERAVGMTTEKPLTIYGIACGVKNLNPITPFTMQNLSDDNYEYARLYLKQADTLQVIRQAKYRYGEPYYYLRTQPDNIYDSWLEPEDRYCWVIETYFDTPVVVIDSFFVGRTSRIYNKIWDIFDETGHMDTANYRIMNQATLGTNYPYLSSGCPQSRQFNCDDTLNGQYFYTQTHSYSIIFPILTPKPTQPEPEPGTVGAEKPDTQSGFVTLSPNPASKEVEVRSSNGMSCLEVYDAGGHKLAELQANGNSATIDVHGWPSGVYIVRVHTPLGKVAKKLHIK